LNKSKLALFSRAQPRSFLPPAGRRAHVQPTHAAPLPCSRGICPTGHRLHRSHALSAASPPMPSSSVWHDRARAPPLLLPLCCAPEPTPPPFSSQTPPEPHSFSPSDRTTNCRCPEPPRATAQLRRQSSPSVGSPGSPPHPCARATQSFSSREPSSSATVPRSCPSTPRRRPLCASSRSASAPPAHAQFW
jgi:hypothetical protein